MAKPAKKKPPAGKKAVRNPKEFDATFKDLAQDSPIELLTTLDELPSAPVEVLNVDLSTVTTAADVVFGIGKPLSEVVHIEAQAGPDAELHRNILVYNALLHRLYGVPVHSIVVLLRPRAQHPTLTGKVRYKTRAGRGRMYFGYEIVRLWKQPAEELLNGPLAIVPLAPLGKLPEGMSKDKALASVVQRVVERLLQDASGGRAKKLLTAAYVLTGLRVQREDIVRELFKGAKGMYESVTYQAIVDEGRVKEAHRILLLQGRERFGKPDAATRKAITAITDLARLERLAKRLNKVASWQELLQTK